MLADSSSSYRSSTTITDVDVDADALALCTRNLTLRDISSLAMSCKYLNKVAYSDSVWQSLYRREWPQAVSQSIQASSVREAYISRRTALHQFKYVDPRHTGFSLTGEPPHLLLFDKNKLIFSQGQSVRSFLTSDFHDGGINGNHNARVTCMRLFSPSEALHQSESERDDKILMTSSSDHSVRLWSKGVNRCFKGHTGPVLTLSDKLLGDDTGKLCASGGEDGTVRLWSIHSSGKRGQRALKATLHGHDKAVSLISVAGHKKSLLVSIAKNGKVRVWDTGRASSSFRSSCCVGTTSAPPGPVGMKCHESLLYVAAGCNVMALDLRTMCRAFMISQQAKVHSFECLPSKSVIGTGGIGRALLWDIRRFPKPIAELDEHSGPVKHLHMDSYKIVTGGPDDPCVKVWEADTGKHINSLISSASEPIKESGCLAMAVDGCRVVTAIECGLANEEAAVLHFRDFRNATLHVSTNSLEENSSASKFWDPNPGIDSEEEDWH